MLDTTHSSSSHRPRLAWAINLSLVTASFEIVRLALAETEGAWTIWTVLLSLAGVSSLLVTGFIVVLWLRGHSKPPTSGPVIRADF